MEYETYPRWTYKPIEVDNLEAIQEELLPLLYREFPDFDTGRPTFIPVFRDKIEPCCPLYVKFIESTGLIDLWEYSAFISAIAAKPFPIHVDSLDWKERCYGLNIPVINCKDTFTVFYDADAEIETESRFSPDDLIKPARLLKTPGVWPAEIDRFPSTQPAWINLRIPHAPRSRHNNPRAIISARFTPEIHDLMYK